MASTPSDHERLAREYLQARFGEHAPKTLRALARFDEQVLEGEGAVTVFAFTAAPGGVSPEAFHVVAGETEPNDYPAWGLSPEEVYCLHLGTRFMLVVGVSQAPLTSLPPGLAEDTTVEFAGFVPGATVAELTPVAAFAVDDQRHAVLRGRIEGDEVYMFGADAPLGISPRTDLPPHVAYRIHLGNVLRIEEDPED